MNWTIAATIAQLVAAVALIVSAVALFKSAHETESVATKTGDLATATQDIVDRTDKELAQSLLLVEASNRQAEATNDLVREAREDQKLAWRPVLSFATMPQRSDRQPSWGIHTRDFVAGARVAVRINVDVRNAGSGPALGCVVALTPNPGWFALTRIGDIEGTGGRGDGHAFEGEFAEDYYLLFFAAPESEPQAWGAAGGPPASAAIFCRDVFGRRYRFPILWREEGDLRIFDAEIYDPKAESTAPEWVWDHRLWPV